MNNKLGTVVGAVGLALGLAACSAGGPDLEEGLWEITTEVNMPGLPMKIPPMVYQQCLTQEDVVPKQGPDKQEICDYSQPTIRGNTVNWSVTCQSPGGKTTTDGSITYRGASFDGTMTVSMSGAVTMSGTNRISGRRIGACQ